MEPTQRLRRPGYAMDKVSFSFWLLFRVDEIELIFMVSFSSVSLVTTMTLFLSVIKPCVPPEYRCTPEAPCVPPPYRCMPEAPSLVANKSILNHNQRLGYT